MPVYRTPDGKIVEEKTVKEDATEHQDMPPPPPAGGDGATESEAGAGFDAPTKRLDDEPDTAPSDAGDAADGGSAAASEEEDGKTRLAGGWRRKKKEGAEKGPTDAMDDPVIGWLVVVDGPGQGSAVKLGYGANTIGRGGDQRVQLNFGDSEISREKHAVVTYDPRSRKSFVQHGGGKNLTYANGGPVLEATELNALDEIQIGKTTLRFVPFCGADFDWQDKEDKEETE